MSLLLTTLLMSFTITFGQELGFLGGICLLISTVPFLFDGTLSLISIYKQRTLKACENHSRLNGEKSDEDEF